MRIEQNIEEKGTFQFITKKEKAMSFKGTLYIKDGGKIKIILDVDDASPLQDFWGENFNLCAGLQKSNFSIFTNCLIRSMPVFGSGEVEINASEGILKIRDDIFTPIIESLKMKDFPDFMGIRFSVDNIENWIPANSSFKVDYPNKDKPLIVEYTPRDPITFYENDKFKIRLIFNYKIPGSPIIENITLSESAYFEICQINKENCNKQEIFEYFYKTLTLMYLCIGTPISAKRFEILFTNDTKNLYRSPLFFQSNPYQEEVENIKWNEINIPFNKIKFLENGYKFISVWYEKFDSILPSINLYISYLTTRNNSIENKFLWLAQAVEALHRRTSDKKLMSDEDFLKMKEEILKSCPDNYKDWLEQKISYGNEIGFRTRIKEFINPVANILKNVFNDNQLDKKIKYCIKQIVSFRNQLTHNDINSKKLDYEIMLTLLTLTSLLELTLIFNLLKQCKLPDESISKLLCENFTTWKYLLNRTKTYISTYIDK